MMTIYKYNLEITDEQKISIPSSYEFLSVQVQRGKLCLWVKVKSESELKLVNIVIHGTGHSAEDTRGMHFIGTFQMIEGEFIGHVWGEL